MPGTETAHTSQLLSHISKNRRKDNLIAGEQSYLSAAWRRTVAPAVSDEGRPVNWFIFRM